MKSGSQLESVVFSRKSIDENHQPEALRQFWEVHPDAEQPLEDWYRITKHAEWSNLVETRLDFPYAGPIGECTVFIITKIRYNKQRVYIIHVLTHKEYDREKWKDDCNC